jgi:very-short-patch-repair endonuclease
VTDPLRTLLDLGAVDSAGVYPALVTMVMSRLVTPGAVRASIVRHSQHGRHGIVATEGVDRWSTTTNRPIATSRCEAEILRSFGLPAAAFHAHIGGYEVDFWIVGSKVVIECDGWSTHGINRDQFEFDRIRDAALLAKGYVTLRVTWRQMVATPRAVAKRIAATLAEWSPEVLD